MKLSSILVFLLAFAVAVGLPFSAYSMDHKGKDMMDTMQEGTQSGSFYGIDNHNAKGTAILKEVDGKTLLVLKGIKVDRVPDGQVYLARDGQFRQGVHLGKLKTFKGNVTFAVPAGTSLEGINSVVIWCRAFNVGIGQADLMAGK